MSVTTSTVMHGLLVRWNDAGDAIQAAQIDRHEIIADGETVILRRPLDPEPVNAQNVAQLSDALGFDAAALATITDRDEQIATVQQQLAESQAAAASVPALQQQIAELQAQLAPAPNTVSQQEFYMRFSESERFAIIEAGRANTAAQDWINQLLSSPVVRLDDARTLAGMQFLQLAGLITAERAAAVLATE